MEEWKANSKLNEPEDGGTIFHRILSREESQIAEDTNCLPLKSIPSTAEITDCRGLGVRKETRLDKLTQSKHNHVSIFNSIVTSVYIISDRLGPFGSILYCLSERLRVIMLLYFCGIFWYPYCKQQ